MSTVTDRLEPRYRIALQEVLEWIPGIVEPVGIVASGSIIRGNPGPSSDLDVVILHDQPWRRRIQRWFNGVPVELFFNSEDWLKHYFQAEAAEGRPVMPHMLATGELLLDTAGRMEALQRQSREVLERGPHLSAEALVLSRYLAAAQVEDALDFAGSDSPDARRQLALAVEVLIRHEYLRHNRFLPRPKERLKLLAETAPRLTGLLASVLTEPAQVAEAALREASQLILGVNGFFEWDSGVDRSVPPPSRK